MVLYGTLQNAKLGNAGDFGDGTTDLAIEAVIKKHEILGDKKVITLPRYVPITAQCAWCRSDIVIDAILLSGLPEHWRRPLPRQCED